MNRQPNRHAYSTYKHLDIQIESTNTSTERDRRSERCTVHIIVTMTNSTRTACKIRGSKDAPEQRKGKTAKKDGGRKRGRATVSEGNEIGRGGGGKMRGRGERIEPSRPTHKKKRNPRERSGGEEVNERMRESEGKWREELKEESVKRMEEIEM